MKIFTKISLRSGVIFLGVGLLLLILTSFVGGMSAWTRAMLAGEFSFSDEDFTFYLGESVKVDTRFQKELIRTITVHALYGEVEIETYGGEEILVTTTGQWQHELSESGYLAFAETTEYFHKGIFSLGDFFVWDFPFGYTFGIQEQGITIYLPENYELEGVTLDIDAGDVQIEGLLVRDLTVESHMGNVEMEGLVLGDAKVYMDMGNFEYEGQVQGDLNIVCNMGNIEMVLDSKEQNHNYEIKCGMGNMAIGTYQNTWMGVDQTIDNESDSTYQLTCNMGNVEVYFQ